MSKTPLKQADSTLVNGAYKAALGGLRPGEQDGMAQGMDDLMKISQDAVTSLANSKKEGRRLAADAAKNGGGLGEDWLKASKEHVKSGQQDYLKLLKEGGDGAEGMMGLGDHAAEVADAKDTKNRVTEIFNDNDLSESVGEDQLRIMNAIVGKYAEKRVVKDGDNKGKWEVDTGDGEFMLMSDVNGMLDEYGKDYVTLSGVRDKIIKSRDSGASQSSENPNAQPSFDMARTVSDIDSTLKEGKIRSLMHDDILGEGVPWAKAVAEHPEINGMTYASLGLTPPEGDDDGIINNGEDVGVLGGPHKQLIVDALTNPDNELFNEDTTRGLMANYIGQSMQKNYNEGFASNRKKEDSEPAKPADQMYVKDSNGGMAPVSPASDQYKGMTTEELLAMYPKK